MRKRIIILTAATILLASIIMGCFSYSYFWDKDNRTNDIVAAFVNTKINARIDDDKLSVESSEDIAIHTIKLRQYNNGNVVVNSDVTLSTAWSSGAAISDVYVYPSTTSDEQIKNDINGNAENALSVGSDYHFNTINILKNTETMQEVKIAIKGKRTDDLNILLTCDVLEDKGYGYSETLYAHLAINCKG